jgi:hypothetical protein
MLSHIVYSNPKCQELALNVRIDDEGETRMVANQNLQLSVFSIIHSLGDEPISLLHKVMFALLFANKDGADLRIVLGMLAFIATWLHGSTKAVQEFLSEGSNLQFVRYF